MRDEIHLMLLIHDKYDQERSKRNWRDRENGATGGNMRVSGGGVTAPGRHTGQWSQPAPALSSSQAVERLQLHAGWV